jgi:ketosteroid isomerase-like protein
MENTDIVRACFASYLAQDRDQAERLIAEGFVFTSPQDDHIGRADYFDRCFPTADRLRSQRLLQVVPGDGDDVFVMYAYELLNGDTHRNTEVITVRDGRIAEVQVFFGGRY